MKIEKINNGYGFSLTNQKGEKFELSWAEFWEICRTGREIDTKGEVKEYLSQCPDIGGHDLDRIRAFPKLVDSIAEQVIDDRIGEETGDQIYYAAEKCIKKHIAEIESKVWWVRLSEDKCISVWYAPDQYDGDQFQMHLEQIGEDGYMGPKCEVLSDESYASADITFESLCKTLCEICEDADIEEKDLVGYLGSVSKVAEEVFKIFGINKNFSLDEQIGLAADRVSNDSDPCLYTCLADKGYAFLVRAVDLEDAEKTGVDWYANAIFEPGHFWCWKTTKEDFENYSELSKDNIIESGAYIKSHRETEVSRDER